MISLSSSVSARALATYSRARAVSSSTRVSRSYALSHAACARLAACPARHPRPCAPMDSATSRQAMFPSIASCPPRLLTLSYSARRSKRHSPHRCNRHAAPLGACTLEFLAQNRSNASRNGTASSPLASLAHAPSARTACVVASKVHARKSNAKASLRRAFDWDSPSPLVVESFPAPASRPPMDASASMVFPTSSSTLTDVAGHAPGARIATTRANGARARSVARAARFSFVYRGHPQTRTRGARVAEYVSSAVCVTRGCMYRVHGTYTSRF